MVAFAEESRRFATLRGGTRGRYVAEQQKRDVPVARAPVTVKYAHETMLQSKTARRATNSRASSLMAPMRIIKKYGNRRLYDTEESRYITQDELATSVRKGIDVIVVDAKTGDDLTQLTLTQILLESRSGNRLFPTPLLFKLVRLGDDALAEFFGRYVSWALEVYLQAKQGAAAIAPVNPLVNLPFSAGNAFARLLLGAVNWANPEPPAPWPGSVAVQHDAPAEALDAELSASASSSDRNEVAQLRKELEELKLRLGSVPARLGRGRRASK